jgi:Asp-tRNA(Asn)/Glu-tRNA(Gln) amidotransferase C subunit
MVLQEQELKRLQELAHIDLSEGEQDAFLDKLQQVIAELERLSQEDFFVDVTVSRTMQTGAEIKDKTIDISKNVEHPIVNNSILVKSVIE